MTPGAIGFLPFEEICNAHDPIRKLKDVGPGVMDIIDSQESDKKRLGAKWVDSRLFVRTYQGRISSSAVDFTSGPENVLLSTPGGT